MNFDPDNINKMLHDLTAFWRRDKGPGWQPGPADFEVLREGWPAMTNELCEKLFRRESGSHDPDVMAAVVHGLEFQIWNGQMQRFIEKALDDGDAPPPAWGKRF